MLADCVAAIMGVWMGLAPWYGDREESPDARAALYRPVAVAICRVSQSPQDRAYLSAQAYWETRLARYVLESRCSDGPPGARCDEGRARGPWQVHGHCKAAWKDSVPAMARFEAGARCALRSGAWGLRRWGEPAGWFQSQRGISRSVTPWARRRVPLYNRLLGVLR